MCAWHTCAMCVMHAFEQWCVGHTTYGVCIDSLLAHHIWCEEHTLVFTVLSYYHCMSTMISTEVQTLYIPRTKRIYRRGHTEQREYTGSIPSTQNWSSIREVKKTELQRK